MYAKVVDFLATVEAKDIVEGNKGFKVGPIEFTTSKVSVGSLELELTAEDRLIIYSRLSSKHAQYVQYLNNRGLSRL